MGGGGLSPKIIPGPEGNRENTERAGSGGSAAPSRLREPQLRTMQPPAALFPAPRGAGGAEERRGQWISSEKEEEEEGDPFSHREGTSPERGISPGPPRGRAR